MSWTLGWTNLYLYIYVCVCVCAALIDWPHTLLAHTNLSTLPHDFYCNKIVSILNHTEYFSPTMCFWSIVPSMTIVVTALLLYNSTLIYLTQLHHTMVFTYIHTHVCQHCNAIVSVVLWLSWYSFDMKMALPSVQDINERSHASPAGVKNTNERVHFQDLFQQIVGTFSLHPSLFMFCVF